MVMRSVVRLPWPAPHTSSEDCAGMLVDDRLSASLGSFQGARSPSWPRPALLRPSRTDPDRSRRADHLAHILSGVAVHSPAETSFGR